jgi:hypothetical protein
MRLGLFIVQGKYYISQTRFTHIQLLSKLFACIGVHGYSSSQTVYKTNYIQWFVSTTNSFEGATKLTTIHQIVKKYLGNNDIEFIYGSREILYQPNKIYTHSTSLKTVCLYKHTWIHSTSLKTVCVYRHTWI